MFHSKLWMWMWCFYFFPPVAKHLRTANAHWPLSGVCSDAEKEVLVILAQPFLISFDNK